MNTLHREELLVLGNRADICDIATNSGDIHANEVAAAAVWTHRAIDGAAAEAGNQFAGYNSLQRIGSADAAECQILKVVLRRGRKCRDG